MVRTSATDLRPQTRRATSRCSFHGWRRKRPVSRCCATENDAQRGVLNFFRFQVFHSLPAPDQSETDPGNQLLKPVTCSLAGPRRRAGTQRIDDISISWWLSDAAQACFDRQLCQGGNQSQYDLLQQCLAAKDPLSRKACSVSSKLPALSHQSDVKAGYHRRCQVSPGAAKELDVHSMV